MGNPMPDLILPYAGVDSIPQLGTLDLASGNLDMNLTRA
jgi:hypothetical protein